MASTFLSSPSSSLLSSSFPGQLLKGTNTAPAARVALRNRWCAASLKPSDKSSRNRKPEPSIPFPAPSTRGGVARVAPSVGRTVDDEQSLDDQLTKEIVQLPLLSLDSPLKDLLSPLGLERLQTIPGVLSGTRKSEALIYYDPKSISKRGSHQAVVFGHGFSQPPENYESTLQRLASEGWVVIAPTTYLGIIEMLTAKIEGAGPRARAPDKLQAALTIDLLRSVQYLFSEFKSTAKIDKLLLCGHSMGSGLSLVLASYLKSSVVAQVTVMAPATKMLSITPLNPSLNVDGRRATYEESKRFFADQYPTSALTMIAGNQDRITPPEETSMLFVTALKAQEDNKLDKVRMFAVDGSHIGFEDKLNPDITQNVGLIDKIIFPILNFLIYQLDALEFIIKDTKTQKRLSQELIVSEFKHALTGSPLIQSSEELTNVATELGISSKDQSNLITPIEVRDDLDIVSQAMIRNIESLSDGYGKDVDARPATALVISYAVGHAVALLATLKLVAEEPSLYLGFLGFLAAGLIFDNSMLALGRSFGYLEDGVFIPAEKGEQLEDLNEPRFILHAFAPLLVFPAVDIAARAGVNWAESPITTGALTVVTGVTVILSLLRHFLLNSLRPKYSAGLLHFTFDDAGLDFTRVVPVIVASLIVVASSFFSYQNHEELLPFFLGAIVSLGIQALPAEKGDPASLRAQVVTGNFGELVLVGSLVYGEYIARGLGL